MTLFETKTKSSILYPYKTTAMQNDRSVTVSLVQFL